MAQVMQMALRDEMRVNCVQEHGPMYSVRKHKLVTELEC